MEYLKLGVGSFRMGGTGFRFSLLQDFLRQLVQVPQASQMLGGPPPPCNSGIIGI